MHSDIECISSVNQRYDGRYGSEDQLRRRRDYWGSFAGSAATHERLIPMNSVIQSGWLGHPQGWRPRYAWVDPCKRALSSRLVQARYALRATVITILTIPLFLPRPFCMKLNQAHG